MGALAGLFKQAGCTVRGADSGVYPPMSTHLADLGIPVHEGYDPAHLDPPPDLVVVGNACRPTHPEATYAREHDLAQLSFPEALAHYFLPERRSIVVAGTHGKTTTTGLLVHTLQAADADPGFLVGGIMQNTGKSYALGSSQPFVVEGDEYDSAYFDKQPKFMHYAPEKALVTSVEFDHADIYADDDAYRHAFEQFVGTMDARDGVLGLCGDEPAVAALARHTDARVRTYGLGSENDISARDVEVTDEGQRFTLTMGGLSRGEFFLPMHGDHNLQNALGVALIAFSEGCSPDQVAAGFASFEGMKRRQEIRDTVGGVTVVDDGTLPGRRGSLNVDDEGTPTQRTTLIENGVLVGGRIASGSGWPQTLIGSVVCSRMRRCWRMCFSQRPSMVSDSCWRVSRSSRS